MSTVNRCNNWGSSQSITVCTRPQTGPASEGTCAGDGLRNIHVEVWFKRVHLQAEAEECSWFISRDKPAVHMNLFLPPETLTFTRCLRTLYLSVRRCRKSKQPPWKHLTCDGSLPNRIWFLFAVDSGGSDLCLSIFIWLLLRDACRFIIIRPIFPNNILCNMESWTVPRFLQCFKV